MYRIFTTNETGALMGVRDQLRTCSTTTTGTSSTQWCAALPGYSAEMDAKSKLNDWDLKCYRMGYDFTPLALALALAIETGVEDKPRCWGGGLANIREENGKKREGKKKREGEPPKPPRIRK